MSLKDYDTAVRYFEQARQLLPNSSRIPEALAYVTRRQGQWDRSESYFSEAERLDPLNVRLLTEHAESVVMLRRFPEVLRKFDQVLNITADDVDTLAYKAAIAQAEVICRVLLRSSLRCVRMPTATVRWKRKFTKRSWSAALHNSPLG
jgi:tetratricopeptide (TPR) repeat protein